MEPQQYVISYIDEEQTMPAVYYVRRPDGRFEAFTLEVIDGEGVELNMGTYDTGREASIVLWTWNMFDKSEGSVMQ
jgi:hypothetical protein